ncbi:MAG: WYL domain-containing protein [Spirochaetota bacterium]
MRKSHYVLAAFMIFNTACVIESAFPGWSALYTSALGLAGSALDACAFVTDHWINRHGVYLPTAPDFAFLSWRELGVYATVLILLCLLVDGERARAGLRYARPAEGRAAPDVPLRAAAYAFGETPYDERDRPGEDDDEDAPDGSYVDDTGMLTPAEAVAYAIDTGGWLVFDYVDRERRRTRRRVRPLGVRAINGMPCVEGFCRLRGERRTFRFSRMSAVRVEP